ncbi:hypothetical protein IX39_13325 [Chryseobacterium formosense]|uniref:Tetratricopeptide repeat protein n=1 Tax=Chryseobacterium formosense TaxID=236814 RepID=A0A085Z1V4_9FLAO|nr:hypothetical protein [Chryseobacterium formosense]KFE98417.1 hypothetical protein IX39_13325 [Chryseobacterium formosense]SFT87528.1 hypothetical protein SAMN05421857_3859 [Chryseobacterium formosense]
MVNTRVLELLKNPKNIQSEDLSLLKQEINSFPYIQNIRALHLYGVHLFDKENYQKELSTTAAYTTDKKILYQLINGKIQQIKADQLTVESSITEKTDDLPTEKVENPVAEEKVVAPKHDYEAVSQSLITPKPEIKHVFVNGERNRILFEGEENFLDETNNATIDLEATLESGVIVTQKPFSTEEVVAESEVEQKPETEFVAPKSETIINEDKIDSEKVERKINDESESSFIKIEPFEPEAKVVDEDTVEENITKPVDSKQISEDLNIETVINEDKIDSEKVAEKIGDESELSFLKIESLHPEAEISEGKNINEKNDSVESEEISKVLNPETIIEEDKIDSENVAEKINDESELSFHGTDSFLPEIKIEANDPGNDAVSEISKSNLSKHEDEMRRLIEEVEKKMKSQKKNVEEKPEIQHEEIDGEISFAETQAFHIGEEQKAAEEVVVKIAEKIVEEKLEVLNTETEKEAVSTWKPMSFESHTPDSFSKKVEIQSEPAEKVEKTEVISDNKIEEEKSEIIVESNIEEPINEVKNIEENVETEATDSIKDDEVPVMNVSFFGNDISSLSIQKEEKQPIEENPEIAVQNESNLLDSNVPGFINTWQSWLKIDRTEEVEKDKIEIKNKVIESFIENNPKISQLKDEVNFVVKEKTDDISHLMTETLANLYLEQKLYTKAINAFQILVNKHPERKEYFENKIQEIKDNRGKN